jgi:hypothetical protein
MLCVFWETNSQWITVYNSKEFRIKLKIFLTIMTTPKISWDVAPNILSLALSGIVGKIIHLIRERTAGDF